MSILNTARGIYSGNEGKSLLGSVASAAGRHIAANLHPANMIARLTGGNSFSHTLARKAFGEPAYELGGFKNAAKGGIKSKKGKGGTRAGAGEPVVDTGANSQLAGANQQLERIEDNTGETNTILYKMIGSMDDAERADAFKRSFDKENAAEQTRMFERLGDKIAGLTLGPKGPHTKAGDGKQNENNFLVDMAEVFAGVGLAHLFEKMLFGPKLGLFTLAAGAFRLIKPLALLGATVGLWTAIGDGVYTAFKTGNIGEGVHKAFENISWGLSQLGIKYSPEELMKLFALPIEGLIIAVTGAFKLASNLINRAMIALGIIDVPLTPAQEKARREAAAAAKAKYNSQAEIVKRSRRGGGGNTHKDLEMVDNPDYTPFWSEGLDIGESALRGVFGYESNKFTPSKVMRGTLKPSSPITRSSNSTVAPVAASSFVSGGRGFEESSSGGIPPEGYELLNTIAGSESPGYNVLYGGDTFSDMSDHPRMMRKITKGPNAGKWSSAAGRYQFLKDTWDEVHTNHPELPKDFSPHSQDLAAWQYAKDTYGRRGNLELDWSDPSKRDGIARALSGRWTSLPGGIEPNSMTNSFVARSMGATSTASLTPSIPAALSVPAATASGAAAAAAVSAARQETATTSAAPAASSQEASSSGSGQAPSLPMDTGDMGGGTSIDDLISKILVAMGVVSQT